MIWQTWHSKRKHPGLTYEYKTDSYGCNAVWMPVQAQRTRCSKPFSEQNFSSGLNVEMVEWVSEDGSCLSWGWVPLRLPPNTILAMTAIVTVPEGPVWPCAKYPLSFFHLPNNVRMLEHSFCLLNCLSWTPFLGACDSWCSCLDNLVPGFQKSHLKPHLSTLKFFSQPLERLFQGFFVIQVDAA